MSIKVLLADDHALLRMGLATLLGCEKDMKIVGEAADGLAAVERAKQLKPDVVIMDLMMPKMDGADATAELKRFRPETKVIVLTSYGTSADVQRAVAAGASGVIVKDAPSEGLPDVIRRVHAGETVFSPEVERTRSPDDATELSLRQRQILESLMRGLSNAEIAQIFGISSSCVKQHTIALFKKLGAANRTEAVAIAMQKHLLKI